MESLSTNLKKCKIDIMRRLFPYLKRSTLIKGKCKKYRCLSAYFFSFYLIYGQCDHDEILLWENCYSADTTFELNLSGQGLTGIIPAQISHLENLLFLDLSLNDLEGSLPEQLFQMENLLGLDLQENELQGQIPENIGMLSNLMYLDLSNNNFDPVLGHINIFNNSSRFGSRLMFDLIFFLI